MDFQELTSTMKALVNAKGWDTPDSKRQQTPRNIAISLSLEAAEILEHFQWKEETDQPEDLAGELADVALYLVQLAALCDIDLEEAILSKVAVNYTRTWDSDDN